METLSLGRYTVSVNQHFLTIRGIQSEENYSTTINTRLGSDNGLGMPKASDY